jgi:hypothetical protein
MPTLNWMGKDKVITYHRQVPYRVLEKVPDKGVLDPHAPTAATWSSTATTSKH